MRGNGAGAENAEPFYLFLKALRSKLPKTWGDYALSGSYAINNAGVLDSVFPHWRYQFGEQLGSTEDFEVFNPEVRDILDRCCRVDAYAGSFFQKKQLILDGQLMDQSLRAISLANSRSEDPVINNIAELLSHGSVRQKLEVFETYPFAQLQGIVSVPLRESVQEISEAHLKGVLPISSKLLVQLWTPILTYDLTTDDAESPVLIALAKQSSSFFELIVKTNLALLENPEMVEFVVAEFENLTLTQLPPLGLSGSAADRVVKALHWSLERKKIVPENFMDLFKTRWEPSVTEWMPRLRESFLRVMSSKQIADQDDPFKNLDAFTQALDQLVSMPPELSKSIFVYIQSLQESGGESVRRHSEFVFELWVNLLSQKFQFDLLRLLAITTA